MSKDEVQKQQSETLILNAEDPGMMTWIADDVLQELQTFLNDDEIFLLRKSLPFMFISSDVCERRQAYITSFPIQLSSSLPDELRMIVLTGTNQDNIFTLGVIKLETIRLKKGGLRISSKTAEKVRAEVAYVTGRLIDGVFGITGR